MSIHAGGSQDIHTTPKRRRKRGKFLRFIRGYLMVVGGLTTVYALIQLLVLLFVEMAKWSAMQPLM